MAEHFENLGKEPGPQWLQAPVEKCAAICGVIQNGRGFLDGDLQELHSLGSLGFELLTIGEGVVPLEALKNDASIDINQEVIMLDTFVGRLEGIRIILDPLYGFKETLQLTVLVRSG